MIQFLTGHNYLKKQQAIIDKSEDKACSFCGSGEESSEHIMSICNKFATLRHLLFNDPYPAPPYTALPFEAVVDFLKMANVNTLELHSSIKEMLKSTNPDWLSSAGSGDDD